MSDLFAPFEPEEPRRRRFRPIPLRLIVPNLLTLLALCAGLTAIRLSYEGRLETAVGLLVVAAILDGLDGRLARLMKGTSRFGAELDSLSDFVCFGVAPALVLHFTVLHPLRSLGWVVALLFAAAMALRLARFNVMAEDPTRPEWQKAYFVGVPAPAGAITGLLPVYGLLILGRDGTGLAPGALPTGYAVLSLAYVLGIAFLTVSRVPTFAGKSLGRRVPREQVLPLFALAVLLVAALASFPAETLTAITLLYLALLPVSWRRYKALERAQAGRIPAMQDPVARAAEPVPALATQNPAEPPPTT